MKAAPTDRLYGLPVPSGPADPEPLRFNHSAKLLLHARNLLIDHRILAAARIQGLDRRQPGVRAGGDQGCDTFNSGFLIVRTERRR